MYQQLGRLHQELLTVPTAPPYPLATTLHALLLTQLPWCLQAKQSWWLAAARAARLAWWVPPLLPAARPPACLASLAAHSAWPL